MIHHHSTSVWDHDDGDNDNTSSGDDSTVGTTIHVDPSHSGNSTGAVVAFFVIVAAILVFLFLGRNRF